MYSRHWRTKSWPSLPATPAFHDSYGYYPGFFYPGSGSSLYFNYFSASAALPAQDSYSTRVTLPDSTPLPQLVRSAGRTGRAGHRRPRRRQRAVRRPRRGDGSVRRTGNHPLLERADRLRRRGDVQTPSTNPAVIGTYVDVSLNATNIGGAARRRALPGACRSGQRVHRRQRLGGAFPLTAAYAAQLAAERGLTDLAGSGWRGRA